MVLGLVKEYWDFNMGATGKAPTAGCTSLGRSVVIETRSDKRVAIVTGGGSGIGRAVALGLAEDDVAVVIADIDGYSASDVAVEVLSNGGVAAACVGDMSEEDDISAVMESTMNDFGRLDILHNNVASVGKRGLTRAEGDFLDSDVSVWDGTMAVNLRGPMLATKLAIPLMLAGGGGAIVNTASVSGLTGEHDRFAYGASKSGLIALTRHTATRFGKAGIRCNAIAPGLIATPATRAGLTDKQFGLYERHHLTPYIGTPEDVANLVVFLASDRARFITGQVICVDGGFLAHAPTFADFAPSISADGSQGGF